MRTITLVVLLSLPSLAQDAPYLRAGNTEVGGFVGGSYGADSWRVMGGGNVAAAVNRYLMPYGEVSYFPGIGRERSIGGVVTRFSVPLTDFHGGVHLRISGGQSPVVPYLVAGVGGVRIGDYSITVDNRRVQVPGETKAAVNFGGGLRYYINEVFGVRAEFKVYKPSGTLSDPFYKATFGFFFQVR
jgi:hypothetical protein